MKTIIGGVLGGQVTFEGVQVFRRFRS
jgi:hypothetical protein